MTEASVARLLEDLTTHRARAYIDAVRDLLVSLARANRESERSARQRLRDVVRETMGAAEVLGASLALRRAAELERVGQFAKPPKQTVIPRLTFTEAVEDMVRRAPVTFREAAERTARRIAQTYSEGVNVAFVRAAEESVTERAQKVIADALRTGRTEVQAGRRMVASVEAVRELSEPWVESYAKMAFRTNVNTAVTAGRFRQVRDPDVAAVIPALRFDAVGDADTRENHNAADGFIASVGNPAWNRIAPPLGYSCRCTVSFVSNPMLRRMGLLNSDGSVRDMRVPAGAFPDPGFRHGGRPDIAGVA